MKNSLGLLLLILLVMGCSRAPEVAAENPPAQDFALTGVAHKPLKPPGRSTPDALADLAGSWVEPIPGGLEGEQGFVLHADGTAASINMATLRYTHWEADAGSLRLVGESIGNGVSDTFEDTYRIVSVDKRQLVLLTSSGQRWSLSRSASQSGPPAE